MTDFDTAPSDSPLPESHPRDAEYLAKLQDYYAEWKSIPSYSSLCVILGIGSKSWVKAVLDRLAKVSAPQASK